MAQRALALIGLADLRHGQRRHGAGADARPLDGRFQDQRIHHRRQHAHGVGGRPRQAVLGNLRAAQHIAAADHDAKRDAEPVRGDEIGGKTVDGRLMDAELFRAAERFAGELDDHPPVFRLRHRDIPPPADSRTTQIGLRIRRSNPTAKAQKSKQPKRQCVPASAATSPPKSPPGRSMPSPSAKRTKPATLIGAPTFASASLTACATLFLSSKMNG